MSMIEQQVKEVRRIAKEWNPNVPINPVSIMLNQVADTIEFLSAKLAAANMERSDRYYGGGWILCEDRLPECGKRYLVTALWKDGEFVTYSVYDAVYGSDGMWHTHNYAPVSYKVIAWMPLPEPYRS